MMPFNAEISRRHAIALAGKLAAATLGTAAFAVRVSGQTGRGHEFNVRDFGAAGDGIALDRAAFQRAIDAAAGAGAGARVIVPGGRRYLVGTIELKGAIDFHLADDAELLVSTRPEDFAPSRAVLSALDAQGLSLSGTGRINGRAAEFMTHFDAEDEWWRPKPFLPRLVLLTG